MPSWRRTLYTLWFTQFVAIAGFSFVSPFIPYYIQSLGVTDIGAVALWAGLSSSACSLALAIMAPIWGGLADRYGRKVMVMRATLIGSVVLALQGLTVSPLQLIGLRFLQGIFTGTIAASTTLVATVVPEEHRGMALGSLQTAVYLGTTLGPLMGGLSGDTFGYRQSFFVTAGLLLASGILVALFVHEDFHPAPEARGLRRPGYRLALSFLFAYGSALLWVLVARILLRGGMLVPMPSMALFVQSLLPPGQHPALVTGLVSGAAALGGAMGAPLIGSWGDRWGHRRLLLASAMLLASSFLPQAVAPGAGWLIVWQFIAGFAEGGTLATTMALIAGLAVGGREGVTFGLDASAAGLASTAGPLLGAGVAAAFGLRAPFVVAAAVLGAGAMVILLRVRQGEAQEVAPHHPVT